MRIFMIFDPADAQTAERFEDSLTRAGHSVQRRSGMLERGLSPFRAVLESIARAEFILFLASRASTTQGSIALSDLVAAQERWQPAKGRILVLRIDDGDCLADPMYKAFRIAGPLGGTDDLAPLVAGEYRLRTRRHVPLWAAAAGVALFALAGGFFAYFGGSGDFEPGPGGDVEFAVNVDYGSTISFAETRYYKLTQTAGAPFPFKCKAGPSPSPNIKSVIHDETCSEIAVTAADGPFVDADGKPYARGNFHPERDVVPVVVQTKSGTDVFRLQFQFSVMNGGTFLLRGLERATEEFPGDLAVFFVVAPGAAYDVEVANNEGSPLPDAYDCGGFDRYAQGKLKVVPTGKCKFRIEDAHPGSTELTALLPVTLKRADMPYEIDLSFTLVDANYKSPSQGLEGTGVSPAQMLEGIEKFRARMADRLDRTRKAKPDDVWYIGYLGKSIADADAAIVRLKDGGEHGSDTAEGSAEPSEQTSRAQKTLDYYRSDLAKTIATIEDYDRKNFKPDSYLTTMKEQRERLEREIKRIEGELGIAP